MQVRETSNGAAVAISLRHRITGDRDANELFAGEHAHAKPTPTPALVVTMVKPNEGVRLFQRDWAQLQQTFIVAVAPFLRVRMCAAARLNAALTTQGVENSRNAQAGEEARNPVQQ